MSKYKPRNRYSECTRETITPHQRELFQALQDCMLEARKIKKELDWHSQRKFFNRTVRQELWQIGDRVEHNLALTKQILTRKDTDE